MCARRSRRRSRNSTRRPPLAPLAGKFARRPEETVEKWLERQLWYAYLDARKCKRKTKDQYRFEVNAVENIKILAKDILERMYKPSRGIAFIVHDPVIREIFAAPFRDRVVHHFLYNMVADWWDRRLHYDSSSCRPAKGVLMGAERLRIKMNKAQAEYKEEVVVIKMDIKGYFMSLPRAGLYKRVCWGLDRQFMVDEWMKSREYYIIRYLWHQVIFDDPTRGVQKRGRLAEWNILPDAKSLFHQRKNTGIVIGNLSSQLLSNIYLDLMDRYVTYTLGYKYYGRYVDDFYIIVPKSKQKQALRDVKAIANFLTGYKLTLHPRKFYIQSAKKGVTYLGMRVYLNRLLPGARIIKRYRNAAHKIAAGAQDMEALYSYMGHFKHLKGQKIQKEIFDSVGWDWEWED